MGPLNSEISHSKPMETIMKRREFLKAAIAGAAAFAVPPTLLTAAVAGQPAGQTLLGIVRRTIEVNGKAASVFGLQQADGSQGLRLRAGDAFNVLLRNETAESTIIHWHGLTPPWPSDGVGDAPLPLIVAGADRAYDFPVGKAVGTHFAKSQLVIRHTGEDTWELLIRRSFSDYFWLWLQDASAEYGLAIKA